VVLVLYAIMGPNTPSRLVEREDRWRFQAMPADENALLRWAAGQADLTNFRAERPQTNQLVLRYSRARREGPAHPDWDFLGYRMAYLVSAPPVVTEDSGIATASVFLFGTLAIGAGAWFRLHREKRRGVRLIQLTDRPVRGWWPWLGAAFVSVVAFEALYSWFLRMLHIDLRNPVSEVLLRLSQWPWYTAAAVVFTAVLVAPVAEELMFRGCIFGRFRAHGYIVSGAVISALLFSLVHGVPQIMPAIFAMGLALAWLYHKAGSLWASIALHAMINGWAVGVVLLFGSP